MLKRYVPHVALAIAATVCSAFGIHAAPQPQGCWSDVCGNTASIAPTLVSPSLVMVDGSGHVYVEDGGIRIVRFDTRGHCDLSWLLRPRVPQVDVAPTGLVVAPDGRLLLADFAYGYVRIYSSTGDSLGFYQLQNSVVRPSGMALDRNGNLVICDYASPTVLRYSTSGQLIQQWSFAPAGIPFAFGVAVDDSNFVYLVDYPESKIVKYTLTGTFVTSWGGKGSGPGQFGQLVQIAADHSGHIYASDIQDNRIKIFNTNGTFLEQWGSLGSAEGQFDSPAGLAVDDLDNLYVADFHNNRICKYGPGPVPARRSSWGSVKTLYR
jgi:tripartite motif-containing protein 71